MFFSSITADYTKMGYPKAIVRALDFLKNADLKEIVNFGFIGFKRIRQIAIRTVQPLRIAVFRKCGEKIGYGKIIPKFYENPDF